MKHKLLRRVLASVMALLLVIGLLPTTFAGGGIKVSADDGTHMFDVTTLTAFGKDCRQPGRGNRAYQ